MVNTGCLQKCYQITRLVLHNIYIGWHKVGRVSKKKATHKMPSQKKDELATQQ